MAARGTIVCTVCGEKKAIAPCALCASMMKGAPKRDWDYEIPYSLHEEVAESLGGPHPNAKQRWNAFKRHFSTPDHVDWAKTESDMDPVLEAPAPAKELLTIAKRIEEGIKLTSAERLVLHKGFLMSDGASFSFREQHVCMNGRQLPHQVPTVSLLRVLADPKQRYGWDMSRLLTVFGCTKTVLEEQMVDGFQDREQRHAFLRRRRMERRAARPSRHSVFSVLTWIGWMAEEHIPPPTHHMSHPLGAWSRDIKQRLSRGNDFDARIAEAFLNHPDGLVELASYPWLAHWKNYRSTRQVNAPVKPPLRTIGGKIKLRVRTKTGSSRHTNIPDDPAIWASLLAHSLSPLTSHEGEVLFAVQHNWSSRSNSPKLISAPLKRSIEFLNSIIKANSERAFISGKHILVVGRVGHFYEVTVEPGAHASPFRIKLLTSLGPKRSSDVCIHQGRFHSTVPLGDTIATVVLSLIDDVGSSVQVNSLLNELAHNAPMGFPHLINDVQKAMMDQASYLQLLDAVRRYTGLNAPTWVEERGRNGPEFDEAEALGRGELFMQYLQHRNYRNHQRDRRTSASEARNKVAHAGLAKRPYPLDALVKMWRLSVLATGDEETDEADRRGNRRRQRELYYENFQRNDWMFLRNHGQDERDAPIGDVRDGERRFCEVFPRVWEAMLLQPIGSQVRFAVADGGDISFEHCHLNLTLRNAHERRLMLRFATLAGYEEQDREHGYQVFQRRDHPRQWARRNLSENLNRVQERFGFRGAPPWWWHYMDAQPAPDEVPDFRWELGVDLRDNPRPQMGGDFQP